MKKNESWIIAIIVSIIFFSSCSPSDRFLRLVQKHPYLLESVSVDSVRVRDTISQDTQVVWKNKVDTLILSQVKIERRNDTFRIITRERPCTTYVNRTEIRPSKIVEREILKKGQKRPFYQVVKDYVLYLLLLLSLLIIFLRR